MPELKLRRDSIYLLGEYNFPHQKGTGGKSKARPALVLQDDFENKNLRYPFVIVAPLTSQKVDTIYPEDVLLPKNTANLPVTSKVLLGLIFATKKKSLVRHIGKVDKEFMTQIDAVLQRLLGVSD